MGTPTPKPGLGGGEVANIVRAQTQEATGGKTAQGYNKCIFSHFPQFLHTPLADFISAWASLLENSANTKIDQFDGITNN